MDVQPILVTEGLTKRYGDRLAVDNVNLTIPKGVAFGYLGPNGAGKTTLIKMLLGLTKVTSGKMQIRGYELPEHRQASLSRVGAIIEEPRFLPHLTGRENLEVFASVRGPDSFANISSALERVGLKDRSDDKVSKYSLGMRQRLGIARCLLCDPELLILDEPMNGLDPAGILEFRYLIRSFVDEGRTVVISSHLLDEIEKTCDAVAIVDRGKVVRQGTIAEMTANESGVIRAATDNSALAQKILGTSNLVDDVSIDENNEILITPRTGVKTAELTRILVLADIGVESIYQEKTTLEDEFLSITQSGVDV